MPDVFPVAGHDLWLTVFSAALVAHIVGEIVIAFQVGSDE